MNIPIKHEKATILINFILDESGSMRDQRQAVISGFNEYIQDHKRKNDANYLVSLTKFSDDVTIVYSARDVGECREISKEDYDPNGSTALYDAIGRTVMATESRIREMAVRPKVLTFIFTDGEENSSREYKSEELNRLIKAKEDSGDWVFTFIGATRESLKQAQNIGINIGNTFKWDVNNTYNTMRAMSTATSMYSDACTRGVDNAYSAQFFKSCNLTSQEDIDNAAATANSAPIVTDTKVTVQSTDSTTK